jgi:hypothetical protein
VFIEQESDGEDLVEVAIGGNREELRRLALRLLVAADEGREEFEIGPTRVVLVCEAEEEQ